MMAFRENSSCKFITYNTAASTCATDLQLAMWERQVFFIISEAVFIEESLEFVFMICHEINKAFFYHPKVMFELGRVFFIK